MAGVVYENALSFNIANAKSLAVVVDQCIKFGNLHPLHKYKVMNQLRSGGQILKSAALSTYEDTAASLQKIMTRIRANKYGCAITADGPHRNFTE